MEDEEPMTSCQASAEKVPEDFFFRSFTSAETRDTAHATTSFQASAEKVPEEILTDEKFRAILDKVRRKKSFAARKEKVVSDVSHYEYDFSRGFARRIDKVQEHELDSLCDELKDVSTKQKEKEKISKKLKVKLACDEIRRSRVRDSCTVNEGSWKHGTQHRWFTQKET